MEKAIFTRWCSIIDFAKKKSFDKLIWGRSSNSKEPTYRQNCSEYERKGVLVTLVGDGERMRKEETEIAAV